MDGADYDKIEAGKLTKGSLVMMGDKPCKVTNTTKAKPGKHGSAKAIVTAVGILDDKKVEKSFGTADLLDAPIVKRTEYPLLGVEDDYLQLQSETGDLKENVTFSSQASMKEVNELIKKFIADDVPCLVTVLKCCGEEIPCSVREDKD